MLRDCSIYSFIAQDFLLIRTIIEDFPETYEDEICDWIYYVTGKVISQSAIHRFLTKMGYTRRKVSRPLETDTIGVMLLVLIFSSFRLIASAKCYRK